MRVVQLLLREQTGGMESVAATLEAQWSAAGRESVRVYLDPSGTDRHPMARLRRLERKFRAIGPDVVLAHSALPMMYARLTARVRPPVVGVLHSGADDYAESRKLLIGEWALRWRTAGIVSVSARTADVYRSHFGSVVGISVIPNPVSVGPWRASGRAAPGVRLAIVGRIVPSKRIEIGLDALAMLQRDVPDCELSIIGPAVDASYAESLRRRAAAADLRPGSVKFVGDVRDVPKRLTQQTALWHPSEHEAFALVVHEAASVGIPVVVSSAVRASLLDAVPAVSFRAGQPTDLYRATRELLGSLRTRQLAAIEASGNLRQDLDPARISDRYWEVLLR